LARADEHRPLLELDGYKAVQKALAMKPDDLINEVKNSVCAGARRGLQHRDEVVLCPKQSAKPKYVLCNGDESEPAPAKIG